MRYVGRSAGGAANASIAETPDTGTRRERRVMRPSSGKSAARCLLLAAALAFLLASFSTPASSQSAYTYDSFHTEIEVSSDGTVLVRNMVTYSFQGEPGWVGISIPYSYGSLVEGRVLAGDGSELPRELWSQEEGEAGYTLWCLAEGAGPNVTRIYEYRLRGALHVDWNRVGLREWSCVPSERSSPISHSSVVIRLPGGLDDSEIDLKVVPSAYDGEVTTRVQGDSTVIIEAEWLGPSSGYSLDCSWPTRVMEAEISSSPAEQVSEKSWDFERFDVDIVLNPDSTYTVRETQVVNFHGSYSWLNRDLSTQRAQFAEGTTYGRVRVRDIAVYNLDGTPYDEGSWSVEEYAGGKTVRVEFEARDEQRGWIIEYTMSGALIFAEGHDRLYWNAVSIYREVPVKTSTITVRLPQGTDMGAVEATQYVDIHNPPSTYDTGVEGDTLMWTVKDIAPYTTFTIDVSLPKGIVSVPWQYRRTCGIAVVASSGVMFAVVLLAMLFLWWRKGRDLGRTGTAMVRYDPPDGLTPAMVGMLAHERPRVEDITATIVDLARRGYLRIIEMEKRSLIRVMEYAFRRLRQDYDGLLPYEKVIMQGLFSSGDFVTEKDLHDNFYVRIPTIHAEVGDEVVSRKLFDRDPQRVRRAYYIAGAVLAVLPPVAALVSPQYVDMGWLLVPLYAFIPVGVVVALIGRFMPRRSREGSRLYEHVMGFREYMATAEGEELERMTPESFQANLPFAMVLGVAEAWARKFKDIYTTPPEWFSGSSSTFSTVYLASSLASMNGHLGSALTSSPGSSGSGGGGGGAGGGFGGGSSSAG